MHDHCTIESVESDTATARGNAPRNRVNVFIASSKAWSALRHRGALGHAGRGSGVPVQLPCEVYARHVDHGVTVDVKVQHECCVVCANDGRQ